MKDLRTASHVPRWGILRVVHRQSVADHSYYVSVYALMIAESLGDVRVADRLALVDYCLTHDLPEVFTSDIPGPVKRAATNREDLKEFERVGMLERFGFSVRNLDQPGIDPRLSKIALIAGLLDEVCYLYSEIRMGNEEARSALGLSCSRLAQTCQFATFLRADTTMLIHRIAQSERGELNLPKG